MSFLRPANRAEASDSFARLTATGTTVASIIYGLKVAEEFLPEAWANAAELAQLVGGAGLVLVFMPLAFAIKSRFGSAEDNPWRSDSFMGSMLRKAALFAFTATFISLVLASALGHALLSQLTAETAVDGTISFTLAAFSLAFFVMNRNDDADGEAA